MMVVVMIVVVTMFMLMSILLTWSKGSVYRIAKLLNSFLEGILGSLGSIVLESHSPVFKSHLEVLYALLERHVLTDLLSTVLAVEFHDEGNLLDLSFLLS